MKQRTMKCIRHIPNIIYTGCLRQDMEDLKGREWLPRPLKLVWFLVHWQDLFFMKQCRDSMVGSKTIIIFGQLPQEPKTQPN